MYRHRSAITAARNTRMSRHRAACSNKQAELQGRVSRLKSSPTRQRSRVSKWRPRPIVNKSLDKLDRRIAEWMLRWSTPVMRLALAVVFVWFGILKPLGISPAEEMIRRLMVWAPYFSPHAWVAIIGWWEV